MSQIYVSQIQTARFTNEETGKSFDLSIGDMIEVSDEEITVPIRVEDFDTKNGITRPYAEGCNFNPEEIVSVNGIKR